MREQNKKLQVSKFTKKSKKNIKIAHKREKTDFSKNELNSIQNLDTKFIPDVSFKKKSGAIVEYRSDLKLHVDSYESAELVFFF